MTRLRTVTSGMVLSMALLTTGCTAFYEQPTTPLHKAAWEGDVAAIRSLVSGGAPVDSPDAVGRTPLYWAARGGHPVGPHRCGGEAGGRPEVAAALLDLGANPNIQERRPGGLGRSSGWTPLVEALHHRQFAAARVLLERGADPNILSDQGLSVMQMAVAEGAPRDLIALILAKGFDPQLARAR